MWAADPNRDQDKDSWLMYSEALLKVRLQAKLLDKKEEKVWLLGP